MISRDHRFHGYASLRFVYQHGQAVRGQFCALKYARNSRRSTYRAAIVVPRKVDKSAVARNRLRRRLYEAVRHNQDQIVEAYDLVFTVFDARLGELSVVELQKLVEEQLLKANVLSEPTAVNHQNHGIVDTRTT
jgi:ribonuclease P protein component